MLISCSYHTIFPRREQREEKPFLPKKQDNAFASAFPVAAEREMWYDKSPDKVCRKRRGAFGGILGSNSLS